MPTFSNKAAIVTGAASGIGFALAEALHKRGAKVLLADIDGPGLGEALAKLGGASDSLASTLCDVRDPEAVKQMFDTAVEQFGNIHFIANNAGVGLSGKTGEVDLENWKWIVDINLMGVVYGCEVAVPHMKAHGEGGFILNTASMAGHMPSSFMSPYHATKFAVVGYSESLHQELKPKGITVSCLCPTWVKSKIAQSMEGAPAGGFDASNPMAAETADLVRNGMDADRLAELTLDMMAEGRQHIFNAVDARPMIDVRAKALAEDYDRALEWLKTQ